MAITQAEKIAKLEALMTELRQVADDIRPPRAEPRTGFPATFGFEIENNETLRQLAERSTALATDIGGYLLRLGAIAHRAP